MSLWNVSSILFFAFALLFSHASYSQGLVYEGTLYDADGVAISESGVNIKAELLDKDGNCVFYERAFVLDLSGSKGHFSLNLEDGTAPSGQPHTANTLSKVLSSSNTNSVKCSDSSDYDFTGTAEKRLLRLTVLEINSIDIADIVLPLQTLSILPFAKEAESSLSLRGVLLDSTAPSNGQVLRYNSTNSRYEPADVQASSIDWSSILNVPAGIADGDADTTYNVATGAANGLMSSSDKSKLDGIEASATADQSAAEILTALRTVDGASSNLDADLLDGQSGAHYLAWGNLTGVPAEIADGDAVLSESTVDGYADNNGYLKTQSLDGAYDDGSSVTVDSTDVIYNLSSTHDFHIQDNGGAGFTVTDEGRVGVGTTSPGSLLVVQKNHDALTYADIVNVDTNTNAGSILRLITSDVADTTTTSVDMVKYGSGGFVITNNESDAAAYTSFDIGGAERMRITSSGNVGIGTTGPDAQHSLHAAGSVLAANGASSTGTDRNKGFNVWSDEAFGMELLYNGGWRTAIYTRATDGDIALGTYAANATAQNTYTEHVTVEGSTGNVGVGTTNPTEKLQVAGVIESTTGGIKLPDGTVIDEASDLGGSSGGGVTAQVAAFATATCPTGWLSANGSAVSRTTYSDLFAAIGTMYGAGNGSTTFHLPDYRGQFLRGVSGSSGADPDAGTRTNRGDGTTGNNVGTKQADEYKSHTHTHGLSATTAGGPGGNPPAPTNGAVASTRATSASGGSETRPKNIYVLYCIKS